ncbi:MAG: hypothetical protein V1775_05005 [Bacteroidota bacterium]
MAGKEFTIDFILKDISEQIEKLNLVLTGEIQEPVIADVAALKGLFDDYHNINPWFTSANILFSVQFLYSGLNAGIQECYLKRYNGKDRKIAFVINPGAPFEGLGEILFTALCGFGCIVRVPKESRTLYESLINYMAKAVEQLAQSIAFVDDRLPDFDGMVGINAFENETASGYISRKPNLVLSFKGCTVTLTGKETNRQIDSIAQDVGRHFGRSYFSIKSLKVPEGYNFNPLFEALECFNQNADNHRYFNHYEYHKSIFLINGIPHLDNGFLLLTSDLSQTGKTGVVTYWEDKVPEQITTSANHLSFRSDLNKEEQELGYIAGTTPPSARLFYSSNALSSFLSGF